MKPTMKAAMMIRGAVAGLLLSVAGAGATAAAESGVPQPEPTCKRDCLEGFIDKYLIAMRDQKVDDSLFARNVRFTENGVELPLGNEGLWATMSGLGNYKLYVPDTETQQVAFLGTAMEMAPTSSTGKANDPEAVGVVLRLRITDGKISEVEQIIARPERSVGPITAAPSAFGATGARVEEMGSPWPGYLKAVPEKERMSRADLVTVGNAYFDAVERNTGKEYYPFTDDCLRYENGMIIVGPPGSGTFQGRDVQGCKEQLETSLFGAVTSIRDRRFVAIDRERGIAFAFAFFDHRPINWSWQMGELFKIENNKISRIEAIFIRGPYGICSGWTTYEQCRSEQPLDAR